MIALPLLEIATVVSSDGIISLIILVLSEIWNHQYLRWGAILVGIAFVLEIISGLIQMAIYTLIIAGGFIFALGVLNTVV